MPDELQVELTVELPPEFLQEATYTVSRMAYNGRPVELVDVLEERLYAAFRLGYSAGLQARVMQVIDSHEEID